MPNVSNIEIWEFLRAIEAGTVLLTADGEQSPQEIYAANVSYTASNGWKIVVFNDANDWDYINEIVTADERRITFDQISEAYPDIERYRPSDDVSWARYAIPGHMGFRCAECGERLKNFSELKTHRKEGCPNA